MSVYHSINTGNRGKQLFMSQLFNLIKNIIIVKPTVAVIQGLCARVLWAISGPRAVTS